MKNSASNKPIRLTGNSPLLGKQGGKISIDTVNQLLRDLHRTSFCSVDAWGGDRMSNDHYKLKEVQALLNYAIGVTWTIDNMKAKAIEIGAAQYNPTTGKFEFKEKDEEQREEDTTVPKH